MKHVLCNFLRKIDLFHPLRIKISVLNHIFLKSSFYLLSYYIAGVEIEDILQSGFDGEEGYTLSPISTGSTQSRLNKTKVGIILLF